MTDPSDHAPPRDADEPGADDELKEACGVFGIYAPGQSVAHLTYLGMFALQHRGQEAAGMSVSDGTEIITVKDNGLVSSVFTDRVLNGLPGHLAIGPASCRHHVPRPAVPGRDPRCGPRRLPGALRRCRARGHRPLLRRRGPR